jgi:rsbT antagonist protein RsbS
LSSRRAGAELQGDHSHVPMQVISGCLTASIQLDLTTDLLRRFQQDLLQRIQTSGVSAVILDVSGVEIMDLEDFELLRRSMAMASIMGARPILVGLRPGIVASLIAMDANVDGVEAATDLDDALQRLQTVARDSETSADSTGDRPTEGAPDNGTANEAGTEGSGGDRH